MNAAAEKTKHTPGPWTFKTDRITGDNGITAEGTGFFAETFADIRESGENRRDEALANARLIVAAPDLLTALQACLNAMHFNHAGDDGYWRAVEAGEAAISKAEG